MAITVFSNNELVFQFDTDVEFHSCRHSMYVGNYAFYSSCYVHWPSQFRSNWGRMDGTPMLLIDVPKATRAVTLLLGLS